MTYYIDLPAIDLKLYKIRSLHVFIMVLTVQEELRRFVMAVSSYGYHFTSPELVLLINNAETAPIIHKVLVNTNILRSNCTVKWVFCIECPLFIQSTGSISYKQECVVIYSWVFACLMANDLCFHKQYFMDILNIENWKTVVINQTFLAKPQFYMYLPKLEFSNFNLNCLLMSSLIFSIWLWLYIFT